MLFREFRFVISYHLTKPSRAVYKKVSLICVHCFFVFLCELFFCLAGLAYFLINNCIFSKNSLSFVVFIIQ